MSQFVINPKARVLITLILFAAMMRTLVIGFPIGFPEENELKYTTGVFEIQRAMKSTNHVLLNQIDSNSNYQIFSCSYSPFGNERSSSCGDKRYLEPYIGEKVTIGWYEVDEFLGFKNDIPQLVTIETTDKVVRDYSDTYADFDRTRSGRLYVLLPVLLFVTLIFYWLIGKVR